MNERCSTFTVEMLAKSLEAVEATIKDYPKESPFKDSLLIQKKSKRGREIALSLALVATCHGKVRSAIATLKSKSLE